MEILLDMKWIKWMKPALCVLCFVSIISVIYLYISILYNISSSYVLSYVHLFKKKVRLNHIKIAELAVKLFNIKVNWTHINNYNIYTSERILKKKKLDWTILIYKVHHIIYKNRKYSANLLLNIYSNLYWASEISALINK